MRSGRRPSRRALLRLKGPTFKKLGAVLLRPVEPLLRFVPIHDVPPRPDVFRPTVLILQIVSMFPNIETYDRELAFHNRRILIGAGNNIDLSAAFDEPGPT